jgi:hypothetical protein
MILLKVPYRKIFKFILFFKTVPDLLLSDIDIYENLINHLCANFTPHGSFGASSNYTLGWWAHNDANYVGGNALP